MDYPKTLRIEVTADDIRLGRRKDCTRCPVARAFGRAVNAANLLEKGDTVTVTGDAYIVGSNSYNKVLYVSARMPDFIDRFDTNEEVESTVMILRREEYVGTESWL